jgi:hypothetical protein
VTGPRHAQPYLQRVHAFQRWAVDNQVLLLGIRELFHADRPMRNHAIFEAEVDRPSTRGKAAASDNNRWEVLDLIGGGYADGDSAIRTGVRALLQKSLESAAGYGSHPSENTIYAGPAAHPVWRWSRSGDLHLASVTPAVAQHPRPEMVWDAVFETIRGVPELRERVRTVTDVYISRDEQMHVIRLPWRARQLLEVAQPKWRRHDDDDHYDDDGELRDDASNWRRLQLDGGERSYLATFRPEAPKRTDTPKDPATDWYPVGPAPAWSEVRPASPEALTPHGDRQPSDLNIKFDYFEVRKALEEIEAESSQR